MTLAQMGADVIRFDRPQGGLDAHRWPVTRDGTSLFWAGLNKGKRSLAVDMARPEGQEIVTDLICAPGPDAGMFLTNLRVRGWMDYPALKARREPSSTSVLSCSSASAIGGIIWAVGVTLAGYFLGTIPFVKDNIEAILILVVLHHGLCHGLICGICGCRCCPGGLRRRQNGHGHGRPRNTPENHLFKLPLS